MQSEACNNTGAESSAVNHLYTATVSDRIPNTQFPFRVFYYAPGMGFDCGRSVAVGFNEYRTRLEAQADADNWTTMRRYLASR